VTLANFLENKHFKFDTGSFEHVAYGVDQLNDF